MKKQTAIIFLLTLVTALGTGCRIDRYQSEPVSTTAINLHPDEPGVQDSLFVRDVIFEGSKEVEIGRYVLAHAQNLDLKLLAQRIVDERANAIADLRLIARQQDIPTAPPANHADSVYPYRQISGDKLDQMYTRHLLQSHRDDIKRFRTAARNVRNTDLREFAGRVLPVLEEHLRIAENIGTIAALSIEINEPAGAERFGSQRDPYYQGDQKLPQLYKE